MSKSFWNLLAENSIEIPIIQRDYAQGRTDERSIHVRTGFIKKLKETLQSRKKLDLDFIYGSDSHGKLVILDGQQRLTTLFLLHIYLANATGRLKDGTVRNRLNKFSYKTRQSSTDFCQNLIESGIDISLSNKGVSNGLRDSSWFFLAWEKDPTVKGMLVTLDAIHEALTEEEDFCQSWKDLIAGDLITFEFLNMPEFGLTDELYIKMNARGKPLSDFENFKAWLEGYTKDKKFSLMDSWENSFDKEWTDLFWQKKADEVYEIDEARMSFFRGQVMAYYAEDVKDFSRESVQLNWIGKLNDLKGHSYIPISEYENSFCFDEARLQKIFNFLNVLHANEKVRSFWDLFVGLNNLENRIKAHAISLYFEYSHDFFDEDQFDAWLRVSTNFIKNEIIDSPATFTRTLQSIKKLAKNCIEGDVYKALSKLEWEQNWFREVQFNEEVLKAELISCDDSGIWFSKIKDCEAHEYFNGQIGFLLKYAKTASGYDANLFENYASKASSLFAKGFLDHEELPLQRALLTKGDYLIGKGKNKSFCESKMGNARERYENWRAVFNDSDRSVLLKQLLDEMEAGKELLSLGKMIDTSGAADWRQYFIEDGSLIKWCGRRQVRFSGEGKVYLLGSVRIYSYHSELHSAYFFNKYLVKSTANNNQWQCATDDYCEVKSSYEEPWINLRGFSFADQCIEFKIEYLGNEKLFSVKLIGDEVILGEFATALKDAGYVFGENYSCEKLSEQGLNKLLEDLHHLSATAELIV